MDCSRKASLLYDSARAHASVGARSGMCVDRTVLFRSPDLTVDVVVHANRGPLAYLHGQVVCEAAGEPVCGASVRIDGDDRPVTTDAYGQFALSSLSEQRCHTLRIEFCGHEIACEIPVPSPLAECRDVPRRRLHVRRERVS
jgi:hypothetical protein